MSNINREYNNAFVHVPKTAGSSMEAFWFVGGNAHAPAKLLKDMAGADWEHLFTWGFVRDPLDRFVSAFFHEPNVHGYNQDKDGFKWFVDEFADKGLDIEGAKSGNGWHHHHFIPQHYFLCDDNDEIMVDFVGRYSHLTDDWYKVCQKIVDTTYDLQHFRRSAKKKHYTHYYDKKTIDIVKNIYEKDYKIFKEF